MGGGVLILDLKFLQYYLLRMRNYNSQWSGHCGEAPEGHPARKIFRISTYPEDGVDVRGMMSRAFKYFSTNKLTKVNSIHNKITAELILFAATRNSYQYSMPSDSDYKYTSYRIQPSSQKPKFEENESEKHKRAKDIFKQWCSEWSTGDTNVVDTTDGKQISWGSSCFKDAWLEYPIVKNEIINSIQNNWDECRNNEEWGMSLPYADRTKDYGPSFVATYKECVRSGLIPIAIVDVVLPDECKPKYFVEICHTNPVSDEKLAKLEKAGMRNLIEIDAEWILSQTDIPSKIQIKRWLL